MENAVKEFFKNYLVDHPDDVGCTLTSADGVDSYQITVHADDLEIAKEFGASLEPILNSVSTKHGKRAELEILE